MTNEENEAAVNSFITRCAVNGTTVNKPSNDGRVVYLSEAGGTSTAYVDAPWAWKKFDGYVSFGLYIHVRDSIARLREKMLVKGVVNG